MEKKNEIVELSIEFALQIIEFCKLLEDEKKYVIAKQLLRSGTSIGANIWESQSPESKADFIHKLKISAKEVTETEYWMMLCEKAKSYPNPPEQMQRQLLSLQKLLSKIISSSKYSEK
jgi:four helix bundle protein